MTYRPSSALTLLALSSIALAGCVTTPPPAPVAVAPVATAPNPVVVQTPQPASPAPSVVVTPQAY